MQQRSYAFTEDWFSNNAHVWDRFLSPFKEKEFKVLEIGAFEGKSTSWLLENVLHHENSCIVSIDPMTGSIEHVDHDKQDLPARFARNVICNFPQKANLYKGCSKDVLKYHDIMSQRFDLVYIDGDHRAHAVLEDAVLSFRLLKIGGFMVFDDYAWPAFHDQPDKHPATGVTAFMHAYGHFFEVLHIGYQVWLKKKDEW